LRLALAAGALLGMGALAGCAPALSTSSSPAAPAAPAASAVTASDTAQARTLARGPRDHCLGAGQTDVPSWQLQRVDRPPEVTQQVPPTYPDIALEAGIDGTVTLLVLVCADGTIQETRVTRSIPLLDPAAIESVRQWTFQPAVDAGEAVAAWMETRVEFRLPMRREGRNVR
jgi:TonB family protein